MDFLLIFKNQVLGKMPKAVKNRASKQSYLSQGQPLHDEFVTPFSKQFVIMFTNCKCVSASKPHPFKKYQYLLFQQTLDNFPALAIAHN